MKRSFTSRITSVIVLLSLTVGVFGVTPARAIRHFSPPTAIDLSTYVRTGRYDLPEPTRTTPPANSLLAQEVSAVTYNWDTDTLFVVGDGSTSVVQISKTGALIDSMTLALGSSPQGTEFYDTEGLTYVGNGQFVMVEERDRQVNLFTYAAGTTLVRSAVKTVKLGTTVGNIGIEGLSYDPMTGGFIPVKEITPEGIFQTGIDFDAGTATNGSPTTVNSTNLFDPALAGLADFADIFALSNLPSLDGQSQEGNLLVLSQESGKIVNIDRSGNIANSLTIVSDPGNPLSLPDQQHEGLTMDHDGILYVVSENGGGDFDHPQLWVYEPSGATNQAPTALALANTVTSILENTSTASPVKVADILVTDDGLGTNTLTVSGTDAATFEITGSELFIKAGTNLDYETKTSYSITVNVDDTSVGSTPDATTNYTLTVTDVANEGPSGPALIISEVAPWSSGTTSVAADWFEVTNTSNSVVNISGWKMDDSSASFGLAATLSGITSIAPGESVIFIETSDLPGKTTAFNNTWFGGSSGLQIGNYSIGGVGLSTSGDAVNLYDSGGVLKASVTFGASPAGPSLPTFNNAAGLDSTAITTLSAVGVNSAFVAVNSSNEIGSPGTIGKTIISEVAPWANSNSPVAADWFEVTNTRATALDITGWKMDDSSGSFAASVALGGITSIAPGESVIFIETNDLPGKTTAFKNNWFGGSSSLQIGNYTGSGVGLSASGDAVNLYDGSGNYQASVTFGASPAGPSFATFDNAAGLNNTTISLLSVVGTNGAFVAVNNSNEIGSPGAIINAPVATATPTVTATSTATITSTGTSTSTTTATSTATATPTLTATLTDEPTATLTVTATSTATPTNTVTATGTATATLTSTLTLTRTPTQTVGASPTRTLTPTATKTSTPTITPTPTDTVFTLTLKSIPVEDGWILESTETSGTGGTMDSTATTFRLGDEVADKQYRSILSFNTILLPDTAVIQTALLKIKQNGVATGTDPFTILGSVWADIRTGTFGAGALELADFNATASVNAAGAFNSTPASSVYTLTMNAAARNAINKLGRTQIRLRFGVDDNNDNAADYMKFLSGDFTSGQPELVITYIIP